MNGPETTAACYADPAQVSAYSRECQERRQRGHPSTDCVPATEEPNAEHQFPFGGRQLNHWRGEPADLGNGRDVATRQFQNGRCQEQQTQCDAQHRPSWSRKPICREKLEHVATPIKTMDSAGF